MEPQYNFTQAYARSLPSQFTKKLESETYCRFLWTSKKLPKDSPNWRVIGQTEKHDTTTLLDFKLACLSQDVFISPNQFFNWRNARQLARLNAFWVEIDTKNHSVLSEEKEKLILKEVFQQLEISGIPYPNAYVLSGSGGIHLYWLFNEGVEAYRYRVDAWRLIAKKISSNFAGGKHWEVDTAASHDPTRVLRLPGSVHGRSKRIVHAYMNEQYNYSFEDLAAYFNVSIERPAIVPITSKKIKPSPEERRKKAITSKHTIGQWWAKTYWQVLNHARGKGKQQLNKENKRDLIAFILLVALRHIKSPDEALTELLKINDEVIGLDKSELTAYLQTALKVKYKYKKDTLARYVEGLGINSDYLYPEIPKLTPEIIRERQSQAGLKTSNSRRTTTLSKLKSHINENLAITQRALAELAGYSLRTVKRYWPELQNEVSNAMLSI